MSSFQFLSLLNIAITIPTNSKKTAIIDWDETEDWPLWMLLTQLQNLAKLEDSQCLRVDWISQAEHFIAAFSLIYQEY